MNFVKKRMIILLILLENEIDGSLLMSDGFDDATLKELIPKMPFRIRLRDERTKLK
jgi:hypothetical protein